MMLLPVPGCTMGGLGPDTLAIVHESELERVTVASNDQTLASGVGHESTTI
jgi:hypothetical protein